MSAHSSSWLPRVPPIPLISQDAELFVLISPLSVVQSACVLYVFYAIVSSAGAEDVASMSFMPLDMSISQAETAYDSLSTPPPFFSWKLKENSMG